MLIATKIEYPHFCRINFWWEPELYSKVSLFSITIFMWRYFLYLLFEYDKKLYKNVWKILSCSVIKRWLTVWCLRHSQLLITSIPYQGWPQWQTQFPLLIPTLLQVRNWIWLEPSYFKRLRTEKVLNSTWVLFWNL